MPVLSTLGAAIANVYGFTSGLIKDQYFNLVSLLLPGNGTNGAQNNTFLDSGTANSGSGFTITRNGNTTQGTFSPFSQTGWGAYFDGSNDYLSIADNAAFTMGSGDFTIECWVFVTKSSARQSFITQTGPVGNIGDYSFSLEVNASNKVYGFVASSSTSYAATSTNNLVTNQWNHIAFVRNTNTLRLYVNGVQDGTASVTGVTVNDQSYNVGIGRAGEYNGDYMQGYISNARITKGGCLYPNGTTFTPSTTPLTTTVSAGTVSLLTCQSNRFIDNSGNTFTVTPNNGAAITPFSPFAPTQSYSAAVGGSGYFDGTGDYLTVPASTAFSFGTSPFTIETWVYLDTVNNNGSIALNGSYGLGANSDWILRVGSSGAATGKWEFTTFFGGTAYQAISNSAVVAKTWTHIAAVRNGNTFTLYIDGVSQTTTATNTNSVGFSNQTTLIVGDNTSGVLLKGWFSNFRIVNGTAVYTGNFTPPTGQLTTSGAASAAAYPSTTNVNTSFASSACSLLLNFTNAGVVDATAKNVLETVGNAQISTTQSKWGGGSMYFDGTGDYLYRPYDPLLNQLNGNFTIECWIYPTVTNTRMLFAGSLNAAGLTNWYFEITAANKLQFNWTNTVPTSFIPASTASISPNVWTHVAVVKNGGTLTLYINGSADGTASPTGTYANSAYGFAIGRAGDYNGLYYTGYIDDFRMTIGQARTITAAPTAPFPVQ